LGGSLDQQTYDGHKFRFKFLRDSGDVIAAEHVVMKQNGKSQSWDVHEIAEEWAVPASEAIRAAEYQAL